MIQVARRRSINWYTKLEVARLRSKNWFTKLDQRVQLGLLGGCFLGTFIIILMLCTSATPDAHRKHHLHNHYRHQRNVGGMVRRVAAVHEPSSIMYAPTPEMVNRELTQGFEDEQHRDAMSIYDSAESDESGDSGEEEESEDEESEDEEYDSEEEEEEEEEYPQPLPDYGGEPPGIGGGALTTISAQN